jgi:hypothetical protein
MDINHFFSHVKKGLPNNNGVWVSSSISTITKSIGIKYLSIWIGMFSTISIGNCTDWFAHCNDIRVGLNSPTPIFSNTDLDIRFTLAPKSQSARLNWIFPMEQGTINLPGSSNFFGSSFMIKTLTFELNEITWTSSNLHLFEKYIFKKNGVNRHLGYKLDKGQVDMQLF